MTAGDLPTISIVVPNYNGAATLRETLRSVVEQNYPKLELIVIDGGSTDSSMNIVAEFGDRITFAVSEKDRGQSHAINKGFARCTGDIVNWLCSDDQLAPGALQTIGEFLATHAECDVLVGGVQHIFTDGSRPNFISRPSDEDIDLLPCGFLLPQPSCFYRRRLLARPGPLDESLHYTMDMELWGYFRSIGAKWKTIPDVLSIAQITGTNKTSVGGEKIVDEIDQVYRRYWHERVPLTFWQRRLRYPLEKWRMRHPAGIHRILRRPLEILYTLVFGPIYGMRRVRNMNWSSFV